MRTQTVDPWRGGSDPALPGRPSVPLPPGPMPLLRGGRPLKRWTWIGAFGPEVMLCVAVAHVGPARVSWWAVWDRAAQVFSNETVRGRGGAFVTPGQARVDGILDLEIGEGAAVEVVSPHGRQYAWTRKRGGVPVRGTVTVGGRRIAVDALGIVDESAGYHARRTAWRWSAGVGTSDSGAAVAWNLVDGLHDAAEASERTVWVGGEPHEVGPVRFAGDGSAVAFAEGESLGFGPEATLARSERMLVVSSRYEQPFGTFAGALPHAGRLREGWGVTERHEARW